MGKTVPTRSPGAASAEPFKVLPRKDEFSYGLSAASCGARSPLASAPAGRLSLLSQ